MRISELSRRSGVSVPTIKYYLREGLLPKGEAVSATRARYSRLHLQRLKLIRALAEIGEVPLTGIRHVLAAIDNEDVGLHELLGTALYRIQPAAPGPRDDPEWVAARERASELIEELGWRVLPDAPSLERLTQTIATVSRLGWRVSTETLRGYAAAAHLAASQDVSRIDTGAPRAEVVEHAVVMTILLEQALLALHRLAQEDVSARLLGSAALDGGDRSGAPWE